MKKGFSHRLFCTLLLLLAVLTALSAVPAQAAAKKKLPKSVKVYDANGKLSSVTNYTYDNRGNLKSTTVKRYANGKLTKTEKLKYKNTYWKGSKYLKKRVEKRDNYTYTTTYSKKGVAQTEVYQYSDGGVDEFKLKYNKKGDLVSAAKYDGSGKLVFTTKYRLTYKNGRVVKKINKDKAGSTYTYYYDKHGNMTKFAFLSSDGTKVVSIYKITYKNGYRKSQDQYTDGAYNGKTVYTYTAKKYSVQ